jgi:hypothetical protein
MSRGSLLVVLVAIAAGCGSDDGQDAGTTTRTATRTTTVSAADAKRALQSELGQRGGGGVVDLERPDQVMCVSETDGGARWHCTIKPKGGRDYVCDVEVDPMSKRSTKSSCAAVDN